MKRILLIFTLLTGLCIPADAQNFYSVKDPVLLYQGDAPGSEGLKHDQGLTIDAMGQRITVNITEPTLTPYLPAPGKKNGASIIILPGGGFKMLSIANEGETLHNGLLLRALQCSCCVTVPCLWGMIMLPSLLI